MKNKLMIISILMLAISSAALAGFTGTLSTATGGLAGTDAWLTGPSTISWDVTNNGNGTFNYKYILTVPQYDISHIIIEVSEGFGIGDVTVKQGSTPLATAQPATFTPGQGNSNPNLPAEFFGLKFEGGAGTTWTIEFDSTRAPVWGDFYAKDGSKGGSLWNAGFVTADPTDAPVNGTVLNHILRPDTQYAPPPVPAPGAVLLGSIGMGLVGWLRRRRTL